MAEKDQNTGGGIKLFGATISIEERKAKEEESNKAMHMDEKLEKLRPEKIIACPRCKSMETKFCYFNNYNVNQPRHFCKACQRYWTAGGALRNVPFGAGRRKVKPPYRGLADVSDGCLFDASGMHHYEFDHDGVVEEWCVAEHGQFQNNFPAKRQRNTSNCQLF